MPCGRYADPPLRPVVWQAQGVEQICWGKQAQPVLAECLSRGFLNGGNIEHRPILLDGDFIMLKANSRKVLEEIGTDAGATGIIFTSQMLAAIKALQDAVALEESQRFSVTAMKGRTAAAKADALGLSLRAGHFIDMLLRNLLANTDPTWRSNFRAL